MSSSFGFSSTYKPAAETTASIEGWLSKQRLAVEVKSTISRALCLINDHSFHTGIDSSGQIFLLTTRGEIVFYREFPIFCKTDRGTRTIDVPLIMRDSTRPTSIKLFLPSRKSLQNGLAHLAKK